MRVSRPRWRRAAAPSGDAIPIDRRWRFPAGFETPGLVKRRAKRLGVALGRAGAPPKVAQLPDGAGPRHILGLVGVRQQLSRRQGAARLASAQRRAAAVPGRQEAARSRLPYKVEKAARIETHDVPNCERAVADAEVEIEKARGALGALPFLERGVLNSAPVLLLVAAAVATFDAAIINQIMRSTTGDAVTRWFVTIGVPLVIVAINHVTGLLAALFARVTGKRRKALMAFIAVGSMIAGILLFAILLAIFRSKAYNQDNAVAHSLLTANLNVNINGFGLISPWWLAPLQVVASGAAISASAFRAMGAEGRRRRSAVRERRADLADVEQGLQRANNALTAAQREVEQGAATVGELTSHGAEAEADIRRLEAENLADFEAERELGAACVALLQSHYEIGLATRRNGSMYRRFVTSPVAVAMLTAGLAAAAAGLTKLAVAVAAPAVGFAYDAHLQSRDAALPQGKP